MTRPNQEPAPAKDDAARPKLGLALAGGGFRASLFHVGVLRRMAELDLLRYVEVLSTVSGGSIVGALYILLLRRTLDGRRSGTDEPTLTAEDYRAITGELQERLVAGIRKNLRTRLLMCPWTVLKAMLSGSSLAGEMARLYEKHIFAPAMANPDGSPAAALTEKGRIPLTVTNLGGERLRGPQGGGSANHNVAVLYADANRADPGSALTRLVLNATSLNSGSRFWFSGAEIGDWYLGHARYSEVAEELLPRKVFMELSAEERQAKLAAATGTVDWRAMVAGYGRDLAKAWAAEFVDDVGKWYGPDRRRELAIADWVAGKGAVEFPAGWGAGLQGASFRRLAEGLGGADPGRLRDAKNYAWYLAVGRNRPHRVDLGLDDPTLWLLFWDALASIDDQATAALKAQLPAGMTAATEPAWTVEVLDAVLQIYYCRAARAVSPNARQEWDALPLAEAVAASAAFPPVFPPYQLNDIYDDLHVQVLSLSDGGAFDNIGVTALLDEHCTFVIASDTGSPFDHQQSKVGVGFVRWLGRLLSLLLDRPAQLYQHDLRERYRLGLACDRAMAEDSPVPQFAAARRLDGLVSFHIGSERPPADGATKRLSDRIAALRTDLDLFGDVEIKCLINEGYLVADHHLKTQLAGSPFDPARRGADVPAWRDAAAAPLALDPGQDRDRILDAGQSRFFRALRLGEPVAVAVTAALALALLAWVWLAGWDWSDVLAAAGSVTLADWLTWQWQVSLLQGIALKWALLVLLALGGLWLWLSARRQPKADGGRSTSVANLRRLVGWWKTAKALKGNLLWAFFKALPLAVLVIVPVAVVSHWFAWRFRRASRDPAGLP